jgi:soluble P-type ATPase
MIPLSIPGFNTNIQLRNLVLDFNGTLAIDGKLIPGVKKHLIALSKKISIHVVTGNTFGTAVQELKGIPCKIVLLTSKNQNTEKHEYLLSHDPLSVISIGNGRNDFLLLKTSAIGIIVIQKEGASVRTLAGADIICTNILDALDLINHPLRLKASLRN